VGNAVTRGVRRRRWLVLATVALSLAGGGTALAGTDGTDGSPPPTAATPGSAEPRSTEAGTTAPVARRDGASAQLDVEVGVGGFAEQNDPMLVRVRVTANELIDGTLIASARDSNATFRTDVEVAAGTSKDYTFVVSPLWDNRLTITLQSDGRDVATKTTSVRWGDIEIVGVLPRLAGRFDELPERVALADGVGDARLTTLTPEVIDLGSLAMQTFDTVVVGGDDLAALSDEQRATLLSWVSVGGILVVDDADALGALPDEWQPGRNGVAWAGLGEVHDVDGAASAGDWTDVIVPTAPPSAGAMFGSEMMTDPQVDLAARGGVDLPSIAPWTLGIVLYALVLGPVLYVVLRRGRRLTFGWVAIPVLAVATAGGVAVAGRNHFHAGEPATAEFVQVSAGGGYAIASALTYAAKNGTAVQPLPAGWDLLATQGYFGGPPVPLVLQRSADGTLTAQTRLEATQASVRSFEGPSNERGLEITAMSDGDEISGTVTNHTGTDLRDVAVFAGTSQRKIGNLADGDSADWHVKVPRRIRQDFNSRGTSVWGMAWGNDGQPIVRESGAEFGIWGMASVRFDLFPSGMARVVGWTSELPSEVVAASASTRTALSALAAIDSDRVRPETVRSSYVRSPWFGSASAAGSNQVVRYLLPADADLADGAGTGTDSGLFLIGTDDLDVDELAFWDGERWVDADPSLDAVPIPRDAVRQGSVLVRTNANLNEGPVGTPRITDDPADGAAVAGTGSGDGADTSVPDTAPAATVVVGGRG